MDWKLYRYNGDGHTVSIRNGGVLSLLSGDKIEISEDIGIVKVRKDSIYRFDGNGEIVHFRLDQIDGGLPMEDCSLIRDAVDGHEVIASRIDRIIEAIYEAKMAQRKLNKIEAELANDLGKVVFVWSSGKMTIEGTYYKIDMDSEPYVKKKSCPEMPNSVDEIKMLVDIMNDEKESMEKMASAWSKAYEMACEKAYEED